MPSPPTAAWPRAPTCASRNPCSPANRNRWKSIPTPLEKLDLPVADRRNMLYMGTIVTYGRGSAVVVATGMQTQLGHIADMIQTVGPEKTPLQRRLEQLGKGLAVAALAIVALVFLVGVLRGEELRLMFMTAISMAVAAVPEGLPAVVTIALALGAQRMLKRQALIRKLPAVETLGSVTTICSDKTGTLTENRMTVTMLDVAGNRLNFLEQVQRLQPPGASQRAARYRPHPPPLRSPAAAGRRIVQRCHPGMQRRERTPTPPSATPPRAPWSSPPPRPTCGKMNWKRSSRASVNCPSIPSASA